MSTQKKDSRWIMLVKMVMKFSEAKEWDLARFEWVATGLPYDENGDNICLCGHPHIVRLFSITNINTRITLKPIGSKCIKKFDTVEMIEALKLAEKGERLRKAELQKKKIAEEEEESLRKAELQKKKIAEEQMAMLAKLPPPPVVYVAPVKPAIIHTPITIAKPNVPSYAHWSDRKLMTGKFQGKTFQSVMNMSWYINWVRDNGKSNEMMDLVRYAGWHDNEPPKVIRQAKFRCLL